MTHDAGARRNDVPQLDEPLDRRVLHEVGQVVRALEANGSCTEEELAVLIGAPYWEHNRFHRVLTFMRSDGLLAQDETGVLRLLR